MSNAEPPTVVVPGNHDGVHLGHRALLREARELAGATRNVAAVFFDPHPTRVLAPDRASPLLTTPARRSELLLALGADLVHVLPFDRDLASLEPEAFVRSVLVDRLGAGGVVVGADFRFGRDRAGDATTLVRLGVELHLDVRAVPKVMVGGERVSSTAIRERLGDGDVEAAARLLGRAHDVTGEVVRGDGRGRTIGVPTANLRVEEVVLPKDGVYAVVARRLASAPKAPLLHGVANLGVRPTFAAGRSVEAHFFEFSGDLYGEAIRLGFVHRIRGEQKFDGRGALVEQIGRDIETGRAALAAMDEELVRWL